MSEAGSTTTTGVDAGAFRGHPVDLGVFSGPLDLLLHLVQKDRIEIWQISISRITEQYLETLRTMEALNVEIAGEFLVMAATLMRIKSQMLLPRPALADEAEGDLPLTRDELVRRLLEYRRYKQAAACLRELEEQSLLRHPRGSTPSLPKDHLYPLREARAVDLAAYLREVMQRTDEAPPTHDVHLEEVRIEERIEHLLRALTLGSGPARFVDMIERPWWRLDWIVTFLAMLELTRQGKILVRQEEPFGEIWLIPIPQTVARTPEGGDAC